MGPRLFVIVCVRGPLSGTSERHEAWSARQCRVDGRASGVYLKTDLRRSDTFPQIRVSYGCRISCPFGPGLGARASRGGFAVSLLVLHVRTEKSIPARLSLSTLHETAAFRWVCALV